LIQEVTLPLPMASGALVYVEGFVLVELLHPINSAGTKSARKRGV
jgi:hypothetical protein